MDNKPTSTPAPIDPSEIKIEITELDPPDFQMEFEIPQELVKKIHHTLKEGGFDYDEKQMTPLLTKICLDEGMCRLDKSTIWGPKLKPGTKPGTFSTEAPFTFSSIVDASPIDNFPEISSIPISRLNLEVTDDMVDEELHNQQLECGTRETHVGPLAYGDQVACNVTFTLDGEEEADFTYNNFCLRIPNEGETTVIGTFQFDEAGEQLRGMNPDGQCTLNVAVPTVYPNPSKSGKPATLLIEFIGVERVTPASIEEVLEQYGTPNETIFRSQIKLSLERNFERENEYFMLKQLFTFLENTLDVTISKRIVNNRFQELCKAEQEKDDGVSELTEEMKKTLLQQANSSTKRRVITACLQEKLELRVSEDDIENQIRNVAESRRERPEDVRNEFVSKDRMHYLANMSMEQKIFKGLMDKMEFKDAE